MVRGLAQDTGLVILIRPEHPNPQPRGRASATNEHLEDLFRFRQATGSTGGLAGSQNMEDLLSGAAELSQGLHEPFRAVRRFLGTAQGTVNLSIRAE